MTLSFGSLTSFKVVYMVLLQYSWPMFSCHRKIVSAHSVVCQWQSTPRCGCQTVYLWRTCTLLVGLAQLFGTVFLYIDPALSLELFRWYLKTYYFALHVINFMETPCHSRDLATALYKFRIVLTCIVMYCFATVQPVKVATLALCFMQLPTTVLMTCCRLAEMHRTSLWWVQHSLNSMSQLHTLNKESQWHNVSQNGLEAVHCFLCTPQSLMWAQADWEPLLEVGCF